jgi:hypothetical protein
MLDKAIICCVMCNVPTTSLLVMINIMFGENYLPGPRIRFVKKIAYLNL